MARTESKRYGSTGEFTLCFPNLVVPQPQQNGGKDKYNCCLVLPADSPILKDLKAAVAAAAKAEWGEEAVAELKRGADGTVKSPFISGTKGKYNDRDGFGPGTMFVRAVSELKPTVCGRDPKKPFDPSDAYAGCGVNAFLHAWTWKHPTNGRGISIGLDAIQFVRDGERLGGGGVDASKAFEAMPEDLSSGKGGVFDNDATGDDDF